MPGVRRNHARRVGVVMAFIPLRHSVEVSQMETTTDRFGNERPTQGPFHAVQVAGWAVTKVEETAGDSVLRTIDQLDVYAPEPFAPGASIRLPDGGIWQVHGNAEDTRHGPFWNPGLVVVHARKVAG